MKKNGLPPADYEGLIYQDRNGRSLREGDSVIDQDGRVFLLLNNVDGLLSLDGSYYYHNILIPIITLLDIETNGKTIIVKNFSYYFGKKRV